MPATSFSVHILRSTLMCELCCLLPNWPMPRSLGQLVCGFVDSLDVLKENLPGRTSYAQENICKDVVGKSYAAHEALADVKALGEILRYINCRNAN